MPPKGTAKATSVDAFDAEYPKRTTIKFVIHQKVLRASVLLNANPPPSGIHYLDIGLTFSPTYHVRTIFMNSPEVMP